MMTEKTIATDDGSEIHYQVGGEGPASLVLLHGWGGSSATWKAVLPRLDLTRFRVMVPDLRGHGKSKAGTGGCSWQNFMQDVLAMVDSEGVQDFIPAGFSLGGKLASLLAAHFPKRIPSLILVAAVAPEMVAIDRELAMQICVDAKDWRRGKGHFKNWFGPSAPEPVIDVCCQTIASTPEAVLAATAEMILWTSLTAEIGRLKQPSLVISGGLDPIYGPAYQQAQTLPHLSHYQSATLPAGHFIPLEIPVELASLIGQFATE